MKRIRRTIGQILRWLNLAGINLRQVPRFVSALPWYYRDLAALKGQLQASPPQFPLERSFPCLFDKDAASGTLKGHYFFQDLLVAQKIFAGQPRLHLDVGSRIDGFVAHVASFRHIELLDIRPAKATLPNIHFRQGDLMAALDDGLINYCDSLSCLHALEHFGLGRYGDPIDIDGHLKGFNNLYQILCTGGKFYFSVPMGSQRTNFNAHRVFSLTYLLELFKGKYQIDSFSYVDDGGDLHLDEELTPSGIQNSFGCYFGCAIFELTKL